MQSQMGHRAVVSLRPLLSDFGSTRALFLSCVGPCILPDNAACKRRLRLLDNPYIYSHVRIKLDHIPIDRLDHRWVPRPAVFLRSEQLLRALGASRCKGQNLYAKFPCKKLGSFDI